MTVAGKYVYFVVGVAIVLHAGIAILQKQVPGRMILHLMGWGLLSLMMFFLFNPYLWPHPWTRLMKTLVFHAEFQETNLVKAYNYPFYQPLRWLWTFSSLYPLRPAEAFLFRIDQIFCVLAVLGLPRLFRVHRLFFFWLIIGLVFLLTWTTKWPQYTLIILVPYCVSASEGIHTIIDFSRRYLAPWIRQSSKA
jgi:hypothetical protein